MKTLNAVIHNLSSCTLLLSVVCPFCHRLHFHGSGGVFKPGINGHRVADCLEKNEGYILNITQKAIDDSRELEYGKPLKENSIRGLFYIYNGVFPYNPKDISLFRERMRKSIWRLYWKSIRIEYREKRMAIKNERILRDDGRDVYFIFCEKLGVVKIGVSNNPMKRIGTIQTSFPYPLTLLKTISGGIGEESRLHRKFQSHRKTGEWFHYSDEIKSFISTL